MYGGTPEFTELSLTEVAAVADMYDLESMKLQLILCLKKDKCHFFHKVSFIQMLC